LHAYFYLILWILLTLCAYFDIYLTNELVLLTLCAYFDIYLTNELVDVDEWVEHQGDPTGSRQHNKQIIKQFLEKQTIDPKKQDNPNPLRPQSAHPCSISNIVVKINQIGLHMLQTSLWLIEIQSKILIIDYFWFQCSIASSSHDPITIANKINPDI